MTATAHIPTSANMPGRPLRRPDTSLFAMANTPAAAQSTARATNPRP